MLSLIALVVLKAPPQEDQAKAKATLRACAAKLKAAESVSGEFVGILPRSGQVILRGEFQLKKPLFYRVVQPGMEHTSDGKTTWHYIAAAREYTRRPIQPGVPPDVPVHGFEGFFGKDLLGSLPYLIKRSRIGTTTLDNRPCAAMTVHFESFGRDDHMVFYFDAAHQLPVGWDQDLGGRQVRYRYRNVELNPTIDPRVFQWKPPRGAKERKVKLRSERGR